MEVAIEMPANDQQLPSKPRTSSGPGVTYLWTLERMSGRSARSRWPTARRRPTGAIGSDDGLIRAFSRRSGLVFVDEDAFFEAALKEVDYGSSWRVAVESHSVQTGCNRGSVTAQPP